MNWTNAAAITRRIRNGLFLGLISMLLVAACGGDKDGGPTGPGVGNPGGLPGGEPGENPGTEDPSDVGMPSEVLGTWYAGNVSSVNFFEPNTGHWDNAGGTGLFYTLMEDGTFEFGWQLYSQLYDCWTRAMVYRKGTVEAEPETATLVLHTTYARMHSEDNCNESGNYDKDIPLEEETIIYQPGEDDYGNPVLYLQSPDGEPTAFHPQTDWSE
ncbi:MAG TPA: hypothetical protein VFB61_14060 [Gemmatimonadales bacterium]|nr:hypothetical protein [Gemmatimonadales bacterium]